MRNSITSKTKHTYFTCTFLYTTLYTSTYIFLYVLHISAYVLLYILLTSICYWFLILVIQRGFFGGLGTQIYKPQIVLSKELLKSYLFSTITTVLLIKQIRISCFSYNNTCSISYTRMYNATKITHVQCNQNYIK